MRMTLSALYFFWRPRFVKLRILREANRGSFFGSYRPTHSSSSFSSFVERKSEAAGYWQNVEEGTLLARVPIPSFLGMGKKWTRKKTSSDNVLHRVAHPHPGFPPSNNEQFKEGLSAVVGFEEFFFLHFCGLDPSSSPRPHTYSVT